VNAISFTFGFSYLLLLQYNAVKEFFKSSHSILPPIRLGAPEQNIHFVLHSQALQRMHSIQLFSIRAKGTMNWKMVDGKDTSLLMLTKVTEKLHQ
jgi:hypothetical protein